MRGFGMVVLACGGMNDNDSGAGDLIPSRPMEKLITEVDWQNDQFRFIKVITKPWLRLASVCSSRSNANAFKSRANEDNKG
jgi:hypothetical protein